MKAIISLFFFPGESLPGFTGKTLILVFFLTPSLLAHDLWVERKPGGTHQYLRYGHLFTGKDGPDSMKYDPQAVKNALCKRGEKLSAAEIRLEAGSVYIEGPCDQVFFSMDQGVFTKTPRGTFQKKKSEVKYPLKSWKSHERVKALFSTSPSPENLGVDLEITPVRTLSGVEPGDKVSFRVTSSGKPVAGVPVSLNESVRGITDREGVIHIRIRENGPQILQTSRSTKGEGTDFDEEIITATLYFSIPFSGGFSR